MKFYRNCVTGEETMYRSDAMRWYRSGASVEVWKNGKNILTLNM